MELEIIKQESSHKDSGFESFEHCDEVCSHCMNENFNIPVDRVSLCIHCNMELFPCSACEDSCDWERETLSCSKFKHSDEHKVKYEESKK